MVDCVGEGRHDGRRHVAILGFESAHIDDGTDDTLVSVQVELETDAVGTVRILIDAAVNRKRRRAEGVIPRFEVRKERIDGVGRDADDVAVDAVARGPRIHRANEVGGRFEVGGVNVDVLRAAVLRDDRVRHDDKAVDREDAAVNSRRIRGNRRVIDIRLTADHAHRAAVTLLGSRAVAGDQGVDDVKDAAFLIDRAAVAFGHVVLNDGVDDGDRAAAY